MLITYLRLRADHKHGDDHPLLPSGTTEPDGVISGRAGSRPVLPSRRTMDDRDMDGPTESAPDPVPVRVGRRFGGRIALLSRLASIGLLVILFGVSNFVVWSSHATAEAADAAHVANTLAYHYTEAATAVAAEESLGRKYRLEPGPEVRAKYDAAGAQLFDALALVVRDGGPGDRALVERVRATHAVYLGAVTRMFGAVDRGDAAAVLSIESGEVDPVFGSLAQTVDVAAEEHHQEELAALAQQEALQALAGWLTPAVFVGGIVVAALLAWFIRGYRRVLDRERQRALYDSMHDELTGLPNRILLADRLEQALRVADRERSPVGLLLIDLDRFKEVNDTFGHEHGDALLAQIGPRLRAVLRKVDTIARLGGDEFAVVLPGVRDTASAMGVAAKLRAALEQPFVVDGVALGIEASFGVVVSGVHGTDAATLLQRADIAMYVAKEQKRGVFAYDPQVDGHSPVKLALFGELRVALAEEQLVLFYQPQVDIDSGQVVGAEALVRWRHPVHGLVFPDDFIPLAEQTGLIGPLTTYVLDAALTQARAWLDAGRPLTVSVNISARNLLDERLPGQVADLLASHGVPARLLQLEVTESALMADPAKAQLLLTALAGLGVRLSIDDFGAGYTSLGQLKNLPVTELKIDKSFIMKMGHDPDDALIVQSIVDLGHNLGMTIVAEGVETGDVLTNLDALKCDVAQGYYHSRAVPAADFDTWRQGREGLAAHHPSHAEVRDHPAATR